jgi:hypothetical protein
MPGWLKLDEFRIEVFVSSGRPARGLRAALARPAFRSRLTAAARRVFAGDPALRRTRLRVGR